MLDAGSPALGALPLADHGLEWVHPELALAHPLLDGSAAVLARSVDETAASLGRDGRAWRSLVQPFLGRWPELAAEILQPLTMGVPRHPVLLARFGLRAVWPTPSPGGPRSAAGRPPSTWVPPSVRSAGRWRQPPPADPRRRRS